MGSLRQHLLYKALVVLDQIIGESRVSVVRPSYALRFVLAYLYSISDGDRDAYDGFWRSIQDPFSSSLDGGRYLRPTAATTNMNGIISGLGLNSTPALMEAVSAENDPVRFWNEVQRQVDQGDPMPGFPDHWPNRSPRFTRRPDRAADSSLPRRSDGAN